VATAKADTLLPLDTFAKYVGISPLHFNQSYLGDGPPCGVVWLQYNWQGQTSRERVAQAISEAENDLERFLGFPVAPKWFEDQRVSLIEGQSGLITLPKARYLMGGRKGVVRLTANADVTYDASITGSTYNDRATITVNTSLTNPAEIALCYPGENIADWQIRPINVVISSGQAVITCGRHQLVRKEFLETFETPVSIIATEDEKYLEHVDVYRIYNDPATQVLIQSFDSCGCGLSEGCAACQFNIDTGCITGIDAKAGIVHIAPATWNDDNNEFDTTCCLTGKPYAARNYFKAGWPLVNNEMDDLWAQAVVKLAISKLENAACPCPSVKSTFEWWSEELGKNTRERTYKVPDALKSCPWGYSRGALFAYSVALNHRMPQGMKSA
jgi:hypothetical protein